MNAPSKPGLPNAKPQIDALTPKANHDRRLFLSRALTLAAAGAASGAAVGFELPRAFAQAAQPMRGTCPTTAHLEGVIPADANPALSSTGQFHHFHTLFVPAAVLAAPPRAGFTTITSLMRPELGIDDFFFRAVEVRKQFHCHQVDFTRRELEAIAAGQEVIITAYINMRGRPTPNHEFVFNRAGLSPWDALKSDMAQAQARAARSGFDTQRPRSACSVRQHRGVTVFAAGGTSVVTDLQVLAQLEGV
jgi:hypothetical protein